MRIRSLVIVALMVPAVAGAQRRTGGVNGGIVTRRPVPATDLPPTAPVVAREMSYVPRNYSAESYTFISYMQSPTAPTNQMAAWGTMGAATRIDYRLSHALSITTDLTHTMFFGPTSSGTLELGMRYRLWELDADTRFRPYVDARFGYMYSLQSYVFSPDPNAVNPAWYSAQDFGTGKGAIAGMGADLQISRTLSLTTGLWGTRHRLRAATTRSSAFQPLSSGGRHYYATSTRLALGLKWNPGKWVPTETLYQK